MIFDDIAVQQFPHALAMKRFPPWAFSEREVISVELRIQDLKDVHLTILQKVDNMAKVEADMLQLDLCWHYLGTKGWKRNVVTCLYVVRRLREFLQTQPHLDAGDPTIKNFVDSLPLSYCLAVRHTTLLTIELINFLVGGHEHFAKIRGDIGSEPFDQAVSFFDRCIRLVLENGFYGYPPVAGLFLTPDERNLGRDGREIVCQSSYER